MLGSQSNSEVEAFLRSLHLSLKSSVSGLAAISSPKGCVNTDLNADGMSYVLVEVQSQLMPAYMDEGSYFSIISSELLDKMGIKIASSESRLLRPLSGPPVSILGTVVLEVVLAEDVVIPILFRVMKDPAVSLIIGLDVYQALGIDCDFESQSILWNGLEPPFRSDLLTKEQVVQALEEEYEEEGAADVDDCDGEIPCLFVQVEQVLGLAGRELYGFDDNNSVPSFDFREYDKNVEMDFELRGWMTWISIRIHLKVTKNLMPVGRSPCSGRIMSSRTVTRPQKSLS
jgi:hypothetical protein